MFRHTPILAQYISQLRFLVYPFIFMLSICCSSVHAQSMTVPGTSVTATFTITLQNVTAWEIQEFNGSSFVVVKTGYNTPSVMPTFTKPNGGYSYRLKNCPPTTAPCTTYSAQDILVAVPPPAPATITATVQTPNIAISWSFVSAATRYEWRRDSGTEHQVIGVQDTDTSAIAGTTYTYSARACYQISCSGWITSAPIQVPVVTTPSNLTQNFTYDSLGRMTFVQDSRAGMNRDYDFDPAGNRANVAIGTASDAASEPSAPTTPTGQSATYSGNCYFNTYWAASQSALSPVTYVVSDSRGVTYRTTALTQKVSCTYNASPPDIRPVSVTACNAAGCSAAANF